MSPVPFVNHFGKIMRWSIDFIEFHFGRCCLCQFSQNAAVKHHKIVMMRLQHTGFIKSQLQSYGPIRRPHRGGIFFILGITGLCVFFLPFFNSNRLKATAPDFLLSAMLPVQYISAVSHTWQSPRRKSHIDSAFPAAPPRGKGVPVPHPISSPNHNWNIPKI